MKIEPVQCKATSRRSGNRCQQWAMHGGVVCHMHGGKAPQIKKAAERRVALAEAMHNGDRRHPWEIMKDVLHGADVLRENATVKLGTNGDVTVEELRELQAALEFAGRWAKMTLDAKLQETLAEYVEREGQMIVQVMLGVLQEVGVDVDTPGLGAAMRRWLMRWEEVDQDGGDREYRERRMLEGIATSR